MTDQSSELKGLSQFEWASVARYIAYVSNSANLVEFNVSAVHSFRIGPKGVENLLTRKMNLQRRLSANLERLNTWVNDHRGELVDEELIILRSFYRDIKNALDIVEDHIAVAKKIRDQLQTNIEFYRDTESEYDETGDYNELPF